MFKVLYRGVEIHCNTLDEVVQVAQKLGGPAFEYPAAGPSESEHPVQALLWTPDRWHIFVLQLQDKERKFLKEITENPDGIVDTALRTRLGLASNKAFGPIITGISRKAKKAGATLRDVLISDKIRMGNKQSLRFRISPSLLGISSPLKEPSIERTILGMPQLGGKKSS